MRKCKNNKEAMKMLAMALAVVVLGSNSPVYVAAAASSE